MRDFIKGWRRKAGCVALVIALVLTAFWVRSLYGQQVFPISSNEYGFTQVISFDGKIDWDWASPRTTVFRDALKLHNQILSVLASERKNNSELKARRIGRHRLERDNIEVIVWCIPYWMLTTPLTLISACLILWPGKRLSRQSSNVT